MSTETQLIAETKKWLKKAEAEFKKTKPKGTKGTDFAKNIAAYLNDTKYFSKKKDYVRAFEAVIWAWAWIEIGRETKILE
ncbi:MAG: DUF357 domain-containing protein [Nanoarchaeota archaeon]|nr:DUF357 domain-containing protein [Nanoarchaeota archaeon]MBU4300019.1 DUF357 domain-containing protein [Nanoarchaeota archaeon]MBU4451181.1 DUF357 domain-containing protein [Nanoarchaeota archaeon]MCG2724324.1 DUF357 domain-containing protein [archaeon]